MPLINKNNNNITLSMWGFDDIQPIKKCVDFKENKKYRVIYNNPATILYINNKKYISKAHNEKFDPEKGLLMCIAKANGISHLELKRMIKNATYQNNKQKKGRVKKCKEKHEQKKCLIKD